MLSIRSILTNLRQSYTGLPTSAHGLFHALGLDSVCKYQSFRKASSTNAPLRPPETPSEKAILAHLTALLSRASCISLRQSIAKDRLADLIEYVTDSKCDQPPERPYSLLYTDHLPPHRPVELWILADEEEESESVDFIPYLLRAREHIESTKKSSALPPSLIILTLRTPPANVLNLRLTQDLKPSVTLYPLRQYVVQLLNLGTNEAATKELLSETQLYRDDQFAAVPAHVTRPLGSPIDLPNILPYLLDRATIQYGIGQRVNLIAGFGTGKTTTLLRFLNGLSTHCKKHSRQPPILFYLNATRFDPASSLLALAGRGLGQRGPRRIAETVLEWISTLGQVVLVLDALDEAPYLRNSNRVERVCALIKDIQDSFPGSLLITACRPEFFSTSAEMQSALDIRACENIYLLPITRVEVLRILGRTIDSRILEILSQQESSRPGVMGLASRPLFLRVLQQLEPGLLRPLMQADVSINRLVCSIYEAYISQWSHYEYAKERERYLPIDEDQRKAWAKELAQLEIEAAAISSNGVTSETLRMWLELLRDNGRVTVPDDLYHEFIEAIRVAMFLTRDPLDDRFRFSHPDVRDFLVADFMAREILEAPLANQPFFCLGRIDLSQHFTILEFLLQRLESTHDLAFVAERAHSHLESVARGTSFKRAWGGNLHLRKNLLLLLIEARASRPDSPKTCIDLRRLDLSCIVLHIRETLESANLLLDLDGSQLELSALTGPFETRGQPYSPCLAVRPPQQVDSRSHSSLTALTIDSSKAMQYAVEQGIALADLRLPPFNQRDRTLLGVFSLIPAGVYPCQPQHKSSRRLDRSDRREPALSSPSSSSGPVWAAVPSFLVQEFPVTNRQFAYFVSQPGNEGYDRDSGRDRVANDYYLSCWDEWGWRDYVQEIRNGAVAPHETSLSEYERTILDSPVVYVDFEACEAFAAWFGARLPHEIEYEIISRSLQTRPEDLTPWPWEDVSLTDHFVVCLTPGVRAPMYFLIDSESTSKESAFRDWCRERVVGPRRQPSNILGGVWEWSCDRWSADWPLGGLKAQGLAQLSPSIPEEVYFKPATTALPMPSGVSPSAWFRLNPPGSIENWLSSWKDSVAPLHRPIRGSSYRHLRTEARIDKRAPMYFRNHNPDQGFRCVIDLKPQ